MACSRAPWLVFEETNAGPGKTGILEWTCIKVLKSHQTQADHTQNYWIRLHSFKKHIRALDGKKIANLRIKSVASDLMVTFLLYNFKWFIFFILNLFKMIHFSRTCEYYCWIYLNRFNLHIKSSCDLDVSSTFTFVTNDSDETDKLEKCGIFYIHQAYFPISKDRYKLSVFVETDTDGSFNLPCLQYTILTVAVEYIPA